jgi:hypothetical protein
MTFDWEAIRARFEQGETAGQISRTLGAPTKQAINRRAKTEAWERKVTRLPVPAAAEGTVVEIPAGLDPRRRRALEVISAGGTYRDASAAAGVSESTFRRWRADESFQALVTRAESGIRLEMLSHVRAAAATDVKAAQWWLSRHPSSRADFGEGANKSSGNSLNVLAHINLGIPR